MYHQKLILNLETGIYYYSNGEAAIAMGKSQSMCSRILKGKTKMKTSFIYC